jgi:hypothetical protein
MPGTPIPTCKRPTTGVHRCPSRETAPGDDVRGCKWPDYGAASFLLVRHSSLRRSWTAGIEFIGARAASAGPAVSTSMPFTYTATNPCTGEAFTGTGTLHLLTSENVSSSGVLISHMEARLDGLQAVTMVPPLKKYIGQITSGDTFGFDTTDGAPAHETFQITAHYIRQGEDGTFLLGDDFYERLFAHITANANGDVTSFTVDPELSCQ